MNLIYIQWKSLLNNKLSNLINLTYVTCIQVCSFKYVFNQLWVRYTDTLLSCAHKKNRNSIYGIFRFEFRCLLNLFELALLSRYWFERVYILNWAWTFLFDWSHSTKYHFFKKISRYLEVRELFLCTAVDMFVRPHLPVALNITFYETCYGAMSYPFPRSITSI